MQNLGTAKVEATIISGGLPWVGRESKRFNFDISAFNWPVVKNSNEFPPVLIENIINEANAFAVCHLAKRRHFIDNYIKKSTDATDATDDTESTDTAESSITWTPIKFGTSGTTLDSKSILNQIIPRFDDYNLIQPDNYTNNSNYKGPKWVDAVLTRKIEFHDCDYLEPYKDILAAAVEGNIVCGEEWSAPPEPATDDETTVEPLAKTNYVNQTAVKDGLWWAIESSPFLAEENTPFWIQFKRMESPTSAEHETMIVISIAPGDPKNWYDILIRNDGRASIIDYRGNLSEGSTSPEANSATPSNGNTPPEDSGETTPSPPPRPQADSDKDGSKVLDEQKNIEIGIMVIAGRLIVFINDVEVVYTRIEKSGPNSGQIKECKIPKGKVQIFATNIQACVNISPMTFAPAGLMAWSLAHLPEGLEYEGVDNKGIYGGSVVKLPKQLDAVVDVYGIDCKEFIGVGGGALLPTLPFFQKKGYAAFRKKPSCREVPCGEAPETETYVLAMKADDGDFGGAILKNSRTPFFFKLKGGAKIDREPDFESQTLYGILEATETAEAPDYFHFKKTATVTVYNEGGRYDYLRDSQHGITLKWGWSGVTEIKKTFTGIIISATSVEIAGRESLQLHCEDYMYILKNMPIVNSPFYDGMIAFYAIKDLAQRAELTVEAIQDDINPLLETPFLPSGYGFTKPAMRFPSKNMIFECMINIAQRFELFIFFDPDGKLHVKKLPGGLFSDVSEENITDSSYFTRNPSSDFQNIILDEKNIEFNYDSTVNRISVMTVDRDTRLPILVTRSPESYDSESLIIFKKVALIDQPALGGLAEAIDWIENYAERAFRPIRKTSFRTAGGLSSILPFDFILVDGIEFRLMSLNRSFSAESNDFTNTYNAEWLGG